ncbi:CBS domain-containing protein [Aquincola sp. J276]|uniref:CBS domain-containing protein n=1 Tax=Aquincola sp. J276 TaxID=2898432 RepID=UPI002150BE98|nr:CBS domain-containing protein [Aquincola sp. J276]MCR5864181.1 CBS domain-containing protein [Aquincola sp. J276]
MTQVSELMTRGVTTLGPGDTLVKAARTMAELDVGAVPICDGDTLLGIVTDRDIAVRGVAEERPLHITRLEDVMTAEPEVCRDTDDVDTVVERMKEQQIRRLPVVDAEGRLVGMLSLGDLALQDRGAVTGQLLATISEPAGMPTGDPIAAETDPDSGPQSTANAVG